MAKIDQTDSKDLESFNDRDKSRSFDSDSNNGRKPFKGNRKGKWNRSDKQYRQSVDNRFSNINRKIDLLTKSETPISQTAKGSEATGYSTVNLSTPLIVTKFTNQNVITKSFRQIKDESIYINLTIKPDENRLYAQGCVWADKIISQHEIYLKGAIGGYPDTWRKELIKCYIYSYYKCLLYALSGGKVAEFPIGSTVIKGHYILFKCLLGISRSFMYDDYYVVYRFDITEDDYKTIVECAKKHSFINDNLRDSPRFYLENKDLDRRLNGLRNLSVPSSPQYFVFGEDDKNAEAFLNLDNFPLGNSFYISNYKSTSNWYYSYSQGSTFINNTSLLFGKACFLCCTTSDTNSKLFYDRNVNDDDYYLVKYEVQCLAGSSYPNYFDKDKTKTSPE